ncbi:hypothetical protein BOTNAR_0071g00040 [Botryotinia narcissicola]|uniref:Alpha/beta hydrolase fold-3 domain-containing protein n=1 Tax=Botryotinia narcissicola TaxID=278944 RepID=A0A4Z1JAJ2_9HELO|nr:hypothetical protein BOTNAR_0071g00040 [Botryotinia narcissicola]
MGLSTLSVGTAVAPVVFQTFVAHYLGDRSLKKQKPTAHISYDEGLHLIRKFLLYASQHTVEDIQAFTSQWVPHPPYVSVRETTIAEKHIHEAEKYLSIQLEKQGGIGIIGGHQWWKWRRPGSELKSETIEMKADLDERNQKGEDPKRVMLYVHGGAYFFGSTDEHRYQMQRHARKLKAVVVAPRYRLAPQFPFPCGLNDCLAVYLSLLDDLQPSSIIFAGDSAGGGMVLSMLVILRDNGLPLPAGAILISPWVDLTHSFPSVAADNPLDYIPPHGFHHRPSPAWPPPNADDLADIKRGLSNSASKRERKATISKQSEKDAVRGFTSDAVPSLEAHNNAAATEPSSNKHEGPLASSIPKPGYDLSVMIDGKLVVIKDQIQMYTTNQLLAHPLVSPVLQTSLGGLPPLLVLTGGGEMLRDEQIYVAHKAANPVRYAPGDAFCDPQSRLEAWDKWAPTDVQLQVWDDLCHVPPTLSFTRPAKHMYRSIAQFGAWALAKAQQTGIEILDDDDISVISKSSDSGEDAQKEKPESTEGIAGSIGTIGKAGDPLPPFIDHMIRQRVDRHGNIFPLDPADKLPACNMSPSDVGVVKPEPVKKWMAVKTKFDVKYAKDKRKIQKNRAKEIAKGYEQFLDLQQVPEMPPPSALAGRRMVGVEIDRESGGKQKKSWGLSKWSGWGSKHDELTIDRGIEAEKAGKNVETTTASAEHGAGARDIHSRETNDAIPHEGGEAHREPTLGAHEVVSSVQTPTKTRAGFTEMKVDRSGIADIPDEKADMKRKSGGEIDGEFLTTYSDMQQSMRTVDDPLFPAKKTASTQVEEPIPSLTLASRAPAEEVNEDGGKADVTGITISQPIIGVNNEEGVVRYTSNGEEMRRPTAQGIAFPFSMRMGGEGVDGVMKDGVRERNARNGKMGRDANASTESLVGSVRSEVPEGYERKYDDEVEDYVIVKIAEDEGKGKENRYLSAGENGLELESSPSYSFADGVSEIEGQGGLGILDTPQGGGKGKEILGKLRTTMNLDGLDDVNHVSPSLSAVGAHSRPGPERFYSARETPEEAKNTKET